jgi:YidC/Oxa1 family membrane protein insertase
VVRFTAVYETRVYRIARDTGRIQLTLSPGSELSIATGSQFIPARLPGIGAIYSRVQAVDVNSEGQRTHAADDLGTLSRQIDIARQDWSGIRNRYWTWLVSPQDASLSAEVRYAAGDRPVLTFTPAVSDQPLQLDMYAGPVAWRELSKVSPVLSEMLFAALWDFLRWLCFGMLLLLEFLHRMVGNFGVAIILLSLSAKLLMYPLTALADRWQADVNRINSLLQPELAAIKRQYKGEDAHRRILAVYEKHGVSQWYTFKSAAGFLIQIPVFIAAFDMLAENFALNEVAFLWIPDLALTDRLFRLPIDIPFFGSWFNLLPFLMTALSLLAASLQQEDTLNEQLQRQQSLRLYLMAAAFFVLFYTFPAGMVLYWTSSNLFHLLKVEMMPLLKRALSS